MTTSDPHYHATRYEIHAYAHPDGAGRQELRLTGASDSLPYIVADTVFAAVAALVAIPAEGLMEWDGDEPEVLRVALIELIHVEKRVNARGVVSYSTNILETITR